MTERLYYADSYLREFTARVVAADDAGRRVYLDRTAFYPTSGGQPNDLGTLGGVAVLDVVDEEERVAHVLAAPLAPGAEVTGAIDWPRRADLMRQHTGQHLLSAVLDDRFGWPTVSVHFGLEGATLDLDAAAVPADALVEAERAANDAVMADREVRVSFEDAGAAAAAGLRKPSDRAGTLRIVTIDGLDRSACGGTHVARTGEIGPVLLRRTERIKGRTRVEFLCGQRAVARARRDADALARLAQRFSAAPDEVPALVEKLLEEQRADRAARQRLAEELAVLQVAALAEAAAPDARGIRRVALEREALDELRPLAQAAGARPDLLLVGRALATPAVIVAAGERTGLDAGARLKALLAAHGGRGGGSPRLAQGTLPDPAAADAVYRALRDG